MYIEGKGIIKNHEKAITLLELAVQQNNKNAQLVLDKLINSQKRKTRY